MVIHELNLLELKGLVEMHSYCIMITTSLTLKIGARINDYVDFKTGIPQKKKENCTTLRKLFTVKLYYSNKKFSCQNILFYWSRQSV